MSERAEEFAKSDWLKWAEFELEQRDPVDALNDAEALLAWAQKRADDVFALHGGRS